MSRKKNEFAVCSGQPYSLVFDFRLMANVTINVRSILLCLNYVLRKMFEMSDGEWGNILAVESKV